MPQEYDQLERLRFVGPLNSYLDFDLITTEYTDDCVLVAIDKQDVHLLMLLLDLAGNFRVWGFPSPERWEPADHTTWDQIEAFVNDLRYCLMSGCEVSDIIVALNEIRDAIQNQNPAFAPGEDSNSVLDEVASAQGVLTPWNAAKAGLSILFPDAAIPISIGLDVIRGLTDNANNNEAEVFSIAQILGSTASLPD